MEREVRVRAPFGLADLFGEGGGSGGFDQIVAETFGGEVIPGYMGEIQGYLGTTIINVGNIEIEIDWRKVENGATITFDDGVATGISKVYEENGQYGATIDVYKEWWQDGTVYLGTEYIRSYFKPLIAQQYGTGYLFENGALFDDVNYGINAMWQASFNSDGSVFREHIAYVVPDGLLVLPNRNNTYNTSDPNALPLHDVGDGLGHITRFVEFQGQRYEILAVFHTHPNGNPYPTPGRDFQFARLGIPSYVISVGQIREAYIKQNRKEASRKVGDRNIIYPY